MKTNEKPQGVASHFHPPHSTQPKPKHIKINMIAPFADWMSTNKCGGNKENKRKVQDATSQMMLNNAFRAENPQRFSDEKTTAFLFTWITTIFNGVFALMFVCVCITIHCVPFCATVSKYSFFSWFSDSFCYCLLFWCSLCTFQKNTERER